MDLLGFENYDDLKDAHHKWVDSAMQTDNRDKENKWTQSIAVGSKTFIEKMKEALNLLSVFCGTMDKTLIMYRKLVSQ
jgi:putative transposase